MVVRADPHGFEATRLSSAASNGDGTCWIGRAGTGAEFDGHERPRRLADVLEVVEQVLTRSEIEMALLHGWDASFQPTIRQRLLTGPGPEHLECLVFRAIDQRL